MMNNFPGVQEHVVQQSEGVNIELGFLGNRGSNTRTQKRKSVMGTMQHAWEATVHMETQQRTHLERGTQGKSN